MNSLFLFFKSLYRRINDRMISVTIKTPFIDFSFAPAIIPAALLRLPFFRANHFLKQYNI